MATLPFTITPQVGSPFTIYAEPDNINIFLEDVLEPDTIDGPENVQSTVGGHTRRRYPGDATPINVSGHTRTFVVDPSRKSGNALPGRSFMLAALGANDVIVEKRQFTFKGDFKDLLAWARASVGQKSFLYMNTGARYTLPGPA